MKLFENEMVSEKQRNQGLECGTVTARKSQQKDILMTKIPACQYQVMFLKAEPLTNPTNDNLSQWNNMAMTNRVPSTANNINKWVLKEASYKKFVGNF